MNLFSRLAYLESERDNDGRWAALCQLIERWTPQITTTPPAAAHEAAALRALLRECEHADLFGYLLDVLAQRIDPRAHPTPAKPPQKIAAAPRPPRAKRIARQIASSVMRPL